METRSAEYLSGYVNEEDWTKISTATIIRAAHWIESALPTGMKSAIKEGSSVVIETQGELFGGFGKQHTFGP